MPHPEGGGRGQPQGQPHIKSLQVISCYCGCLCLAGLQSGLMPCFGAWRCSGGSLLAVALRRRLYLNPVLLSLCAMCLFSAPQLVRDFIHDSLYHPSEGYFSRQTASGARRRCMPCGAGSLLGKALRRRAREGPISRPPVVATALSWCPDLPLR